MEMKVGDTLLLFTDGVTDASNLQQESFGDERLTDCIAYEPARTARETVDRVLRAVREFSAGAPHSTTSRSWPSGMSQGANSSLRTSVRSGT